MTTAGHAMPTPQQVFGPSTFPAAYTELHDGELGPAEGHIDRATARSQVRTGIWQPDDAVVARRAVNEPVTPPRRHRRPVTEHPMASLCLTHEQQVRGEVDLHRYSLLRAHMALSPTGNTTLDVPAGDPLKKLTRELRRRRSPDSCGTRLDRIAGHGDHRQRPGRPTRSRADLDS